MANGCQAADAHKCLGVDFTAGKYIQFDAMKKRTGKALDKARRIAWANRYVGKATQAVRSFVAGAAAYGGETHGTPNSILNRVRTAIRATIGTRAKGGSLTLEMMMSNTKQLDHNYRANRILSWRGPLACFEATK